MSIYIVGLFDFYLASKKSLSKLRHVRSFSPSTVGIELASPDIWAYRTLAPDTFGSSILAVGSSSSSLVYVILEKEEAVYDVLATIDLTAQVCVLYNTHGFHIQVHKCGKYMFSLKPKTMVYAVKDSVLQSVIMVSLHYLS